MHRTWLLLPLLACGPSDQGITNLVPEIAVSPPALDFGEVASPLTEEQLVYVNNAGRAELEAHYTITGEGKEAFHVEVAGANVGAGETFTLPVTFTPPTYLPYTATLVISSNDKEAPEIEVPLSGVGVYAPAPDICITPSPMDWQMVAPGSSVPMVLSVKNCGDATLELGVMDQVGGGAFRVDTATDPSNATVAAGETQPVFVYYEPTNDLGDCGTLSFPSNDVDEPVTEVMMLGNGGGDCEYPVAVIDCPGFSAPPQEVALDGTGSYDPGGLEPLTYEWSLTGKPNGSSAELTEFQLANTVLFTDIGGEYEVQLQVTNTLGVKSAPERCIIDAVPADDIHVELTWNTTGVDLDLHLLQNTTAAMYDVPEDCNWCNRNPSWGTGGAEDDPRLDLDDRSDGPENINILTPSNGAYPVYVHYYDPVGGPATTATVTVYTNGVEVFSDSKVMSRNQVWKVGQINWPDGSFGVYPDPLENATRRDCP